MNYDNWKLQTPFEKEDVYYCNVCDTEINHEGICNSTACFKADNI